MIGPSNKFWRMKTNLLRRACFVLILLSGFLSFASLAYSEDWAWKDEAGHPAANTESRISKNGFGGWLVVTSDTDWEKKWETSPETVPHFTTSETVERGKQLTVLIFFVNPRVDEKNNADITCDIQSIRPDGSLSINSHDVVCYRARIEGSPYNIRLSAPIIKYIGEEKDLAGKWTIRVTLKDNLRHVRLPLQAAFTLK
jgi:hypothetical protein